MPTNYRQIFAIRKKNSELLRRQNPSLSHNPGIYFLTRTDENGIPFFYIGQSIDVLDRLISHMSGYQHIDLSLKKRGLYSKENPYGWKVNFMNYPVEKLDEMEQYWILEYTKRGYQCRYNKTSGSQGEGKEKINEFRPAKGYRDGLEQGYRKASKEVSHLFDLHLDVKTKSDKPNKLQKKALQKFNDFLEYHKGGENT